MKIALLGFGTVGGGVWELLQGNPDWDIAWVLTRRTRPELGSRAVFTMEPILADPEVELVVEVLGGIRPAFDYVAAALQAGKHVVTANKALMAAHYDELTALARQNGVALRCTGAVGGGIPFLTALERVRRLDRVRSVSGIVNGTTNYILDRMTREGSGFDAVLADAQDLGYAEADPSADLDGLDVRRKLVLMANVAFGVSLREEEIPMAGIRGVTAEDIAAFRQAGLVCRMLATASREEGGVSAVAEPALVPDSAPEAAVPLNCNRITVTGERLGEQAFFGQGAGRYPTAMNVLQDCMDIASGCRSFYTERALPCPVDNDTLRRPYYVRTGDEKPFAGLIAGRLGPGFVTRPMAVPELHRRIPGCRFTAAVDNAFFAQHFA